MAAKATSFPAYQQRPPAHGIPIRCGAQMRRALEPVKEYERGLREISAMGKKIKMRPNPGAAMTDLG